MLTDTELLDAMTNAPTGWTTQTTLLAIGRAIETAVLDKQARLLRECELAGAPTFYFKRDKDGADQEAVGRCPWCGATGVGFDESERPSDYCGHDPALVRPAGAGGGELLTELRAAHQIILNALALMTPEQKAVWAQANDRDGVIGEGTTRFHERAAAIAKAAA